MLKIKEIKKVFYPGTEEENIVFDNLSLEINSNECTAILGPNGCGKSTLLNIISGSVKQNGGDILLGDLDLGSMTEEKRASHIGKVYQDPSKGVAPDLTILENMSLALKKGEKFTFKKLIKKSLEGQIIEKLKILNLGLEKKLNTKVKFLSGGQRQALSLLMATIKRPELLLLDEHTAALDPKTSRLIMQISSELIKKEKMTTLMISHNLAHAIEYSDRIIMLNKGRVSLDLPSSQITEEDLVKIYNQNIENLELQ
ncbi:ATP-binding cassette domain-containing protein [Peptoniphilus sp. GNH]|nr:ATP-binding cassette domain-containing protein [Peptoniphilus sp. GNH]